MLSIKCPFEISHFQDRHGHMHAVEMVNGERRLTIDEGSFRSLCANQHGGDQWHAANIDLIRQLMPR
jgi:hypothetical protein